jgi:hypothetical protein
MTQPWQPGLTVFRHAATPAQQIAARDLFALGCFLSKLGKRDAASTACWSALEAIGAPRDEIRDVVPTVNSDHAWVKENVGPHAEILSLFDEADA